MAINKQAGTIFDFMKNYCVALNMTRKKERPLEVTFPVTKYAG